MSEPTAPGARNMQAPRPPRAPLRLPLQLGHSPLVELAVTGALTLPVAAIAAAYLLRSDGWVTRIVAGLVLAAALALAALLSGPAFWTTRPVDVVLGPRGLRFEGGPHHGREIAWSALDLNRCRLENDAGNEDPPGAPLRGVQLLVGVRDAPDLLVAEIYQDPDREALHCLLESIRAVLDNQPGALGRSAVGVDALACDDCGAPAPPADAASVSCRYCHGTVDVPPGIRRRVAEMAEVHRLEAHEQRWLARVLSQPGARATSALVAALSLPMLGAVPAATLLVFLQPAPTHALGLLGLGAAIATVLTALFVGLAAITRRQALRGCTLQMGARRSSDPRCPYVCRGCGASLPGDAEVVVRCAYCSTHSVLGIDVRPWAHRAQADTATLQSLIEERTANGRARVGTAAVLGVIAALFGLAFLVALG